jgi:hypothetical protein
MGSAKLADLTITDGAIASAPFTGNALKVIRVNAGETAYEAATGGAGDFLADGSVPMTGDLDFAQNQALQFVLENRTSDPGAPVAGQMWLRTDL